jgi:hypothetical protein
MSNALESTFGRFCELHKEGNGHLLYLTPQYTKLAKLKFQYRLAQEKGESQRMNNLEILISLHRAIVYEDFNLAADLRRCID